VKLATAQTSIQASPETQQELVEAVQKGWIGLVYSGSTASRSYV
jgi:hypothetical protein